MSFCHLTLTLLLQKTLVVENAEQWIEAAIFTRLHEADRQVEAMREGLGEVIPLGMLVQFFLIVDPPSPFPAPAQYISEPMSELVCSRARPCKYSPAPISDRHTK